MAFLLPPDHGLDLAKTSLALIDGTRAVALTDCPLMLASLSVAAYRQPPPAGLAAGLRRLLDEAASGASSSSNNSSSSSSSSGGIGGSSSSSSSSSGGIGGSSNICEGASGATLSSGLALRQLAEHADRFELELAVEAGLGGTVSSSGLSVEFPGAPPGGGACTQLKVCGPTCLQASRRMQKVCCVADAGNE